VSIRALQSLARSPINQARSVLFAAERTDPYIFEERKEVLDAVLAPLYIRIPFLVILAFVLSKATGVLGLPKELQSLVLWGIALSLPIIVIFLLASVTLWSIVGSDYKGKLLDAHGDLRLLAISFAGHVVSFGVGGVGGLVAPGSYAA